MEKNLLHHRVSLEGELIVVVEIRELLLRQLNSARTRNVIHGALLKEVIKRIALILEAGRLNLAALVHQVDAKQLPFSILIVPRPDIRLVRDPRLDGPPVLVGRQRLDRVDVAVRRVGRPTRPRRHARGLRLWRGFLLAIEAVARNGRGLRVLLRLFGLDLHGLGVADLFPLAVLV